MKHRTWKSILKNTNLRWGVLIMSLYIVWMISWLIYAYLIKGNIFHHYQPEINIERELIKPFSKGSLLGTDTLGHSVIEILSSGLSYSLTLGFLVTFFSVSIGITIGFFSAHGSRYLNYLLDMMTNLVFIFPSILIAIVFMSVSGQSLTGLFFILVFTNWPGYARISRGEIKRVLGLGYIESAKAIGMSDMRLLFTAILPAILPQMIIHSILGINGVIVSESFLGFLGLGGSSYSWGAMLSMANKVLLEAPFLIVIISIAMAGLIIGLNLIGDGLRDVLDPRNTH